ncbi:MAG: TetR/AcrR family transcriptional regulator [Proteobacteria bacterium]|nr:MAG: TetR/AcrR family transcriptional regulator [Pseudomonadota bacterium]
MTKLGKGELTQARVIEASLKVFGKKGFFESSISEIAESAGLSQAGVLKHFPSKVRVFEAVIHHVLTTNHEIVASLTQPNEMGLASLDTYLAGNIEWLRRQPHQARMILLLYYQSSFDPVFTEIYAQVLKISRARLLRYVVEADRIGEIRLKSEDRETLAESLQELILGMLLNVITAPPRAKSPLAEMREKIEFIVAPLRKLPKNPR